jgi:uncharacterized protein DUF4031
MTIYVDNAGIPADVHNVETGKTVSSRWYHLISDQLDTTELHHFATNVLGLRRSYFQPGKALGKPDQPDPGGDHYDLTEGKRKTAIAQGAVPITAEDLGVITRRKRMAHRGVPDIKSIAERLATEEGTFSLSFHKGQWSVAIEWGQEAEDSPMVAAAAYGLGTTAREAIEAAVREAGWS